MTPNQLHQVISYNIFRVIELCYSQGVTTTWKDIYLFLRIPSHIWSMEQDIDEKIIIDSEEELETMRELLISRFSARH